MSAAAAAGARARNHAERFTPFFYPYSSPVKGAIASSGGSTIYRQFTASSRAHRAGRATSLSVKADEIQPALSSEARRAAFQAGWDARLLPLLTPQWQSSAALAGALGEKPATVLERLKDMLERGLVERRVVQSKPSKPGKKGKRPRIHTARFEAHFRLPPA